MCIISQQFQNKGHIYTHFTDEKQKYRDDKKLDQGYLHGSVRAEFAALILAPEPGADPFAGHGMDLTSSSANIY